jgi:pyruvate-formate lyase-activating enzyme
MLSVALVDRHGHIMRNDNARAVGRAGDYFVELSPDDVIPLPEGATLMRLPGRTPVGVANTLGRAGRVERADAASGGEEFVLAGPGEAVSVMLPGGYTRTLLPAYQAGPDAPALPLFGYTAVAFDGDELVVAAVRTDERDTWDPRHYNLDLLPGAVRERLSRAPQNRVLAQLARCSLEYGCFTAQNVFYRRWEGGIPVSPACNARCIGCISEQPSECCPSPQQRINFVPTPDEVAEVAIEHLENAPEGIISFGQGCEGEPTLQHALIAESVRRVRRATTRGTININTNAGNTAAIREVCEAGVDSLRVSLISALPEMYTAYHRPQGYGLEDVARSIMLARSMGVFVSLNYLCYPGFSDTEPEVDALVSLIDDTDVNMVQLRNLNIDPDVFSSTMLKPFPAREPRGVANVIQHLQDCFPELLIGNFSTAVADVHED